MSVGQHVITYRLLAAGSNGCGQLGVGHEDDVHSWRACQSQSSSAVFPPPGDEVIALESGASHTLALVQSREGIRRVWASGSGEQGQLGYLNGKRTSFEVMEKDRVIHGSHWTASKVACGWNSSFLVYEDAQEQESDKLIVFGSCNDFGQLGIGSRQNTGSIDQVDLAVPLSSIATSLNSVVARWKVVEVRCGVRHVLLLCSTVIQGGQSMLALIGWGATRQGQVIPVQRDARGKTTGSPIVWSPTVLAAWTAATSSLSFGTLLSAGKEHSALYIPSHWDQVHDKYLARDTALNLPDVGRLHIFGSNKHGQLDLILAIGQLSGWTPSRMRCTWNGTYLLMLSGADATPRVLCAGNNSKGQLGCAKEDRKADLQLDGQSTKLDLVCGSEHVLVRTDTDVLAWGWNEHGNLAQGDTQDRRRPTKIWAAEGASQASFAMRAVRVFAGCGTTFVEVVEGR